MIKDPLNFPKILAEGAAKTLAAAMSQTGISYSDAVKALTQDEGIGGCSDRLYLCEGGSKLEVADTKTQVKCSYCGSIKEDKTKNCVNCGANK